MATAATLTASTLEGQLMEVVALLQEAEADETRNPNGDNNVTSTVDVDALTFSGTFSVPVTQTVVEGNITYPASAYLTD
ncbi:MAG: hypothetical protein ACLFT0_12535 [Spirulinaceae cyanobacterium]